MKKSAFVLFCFLPFFLSAQQKSVTLSGEIKDKTSQEAVPYVTVSLKNSTDGSFVMGTLTDEEGRFVLTNVKPANYTIET